jgi:hypothetical protein
VHLDLETSAGPAWKPLPVAISSVLAVVGAAAPTGWLLVARFAALGAVALGFALARRLAGGSIPAGLAAASGVLLCTGFVPHAAVGNSEGMGVALALAAVACALDGRARMALLVGFALALLRPESWPVLALYAVALGRRGAHRRLILALGLSLPVLWFVPDLLASGDLLRSFGRAQVPNPGAPALAERPALASISRATAVPLPPLLLGALALGVRAVRAPADRPALVPGAAGTAWIAIVAAMSEAGFSGEERYALPGAALIGVSGAVGLERIVRALGSRTPGRRVGLLGALAPLLICLAFALPRLGELAAESRQLAHGAALATDLPRAVEAAGGAEALLRCGRPHTGRYRGPVVAWHLGVHKARVGFAPAAPGVVLRSPLRSGARPSPDVPRGFRLAAVHGLWQVWTACPPES